MIIGQNQVSGDVKRILEIFVNSDCAIKPHFFITGASGTGKTFIMNTLAKELDINFIKVNAAQLTKEGTSGASVSKALSPLLQIQRQPTIVFVDEFDKLLIAGNSNSELAHATTTGVQNEFLTILEDGTAHVYGDYGKYVDVSVDNVLFVFAGAFNGEDDLDVGRLRDLGVKNEFLGRVPIVYNTKPFTLADLHNILENSELLDNYIQLFKMDKSKVMPDLKSILEEEYEKNLLGARMVKTIIHKYFIKGGKEKKKEKKGISPKKDMKF